MSYIWLQGTHADDCGPIIFRGDASAALRATRVMGLMVVWNAYNEWRVLQSRKLAVGRAYMSGLRDAFAGRMGPRQARRPTC